MSQYKSILFDFDGTLIDTHAFLVQLNRDICAKLNLPDDLTENLHLQVFDNDPGLSDEIKTYFKEQNKLRQPQEITFYDGVAMILQQLKNKGFVLGIVTNTFRERAEVLLKQKNSLGLFDVLVTQEDTIKHKPDPEPVLLAMQKLGAKVEDTLYVGDNSVDIQAANSIGIDSVYFETSIEPNIHKYNPTYKIKNFAELLDILEVK